MVLLQTHFVTQSSRLDGVEITSIVLSINYLVKCKYSLFIVLKKPRFRRIESILLFYYQQSFIEFFNTSFWTLLIYIFSVAFGLNIKNIKRTLNNKDTLKCIGIQYTHRQFRIIPPCLLLLIPVWYNQEVCTYIIYIFYIL